MNIEEFTETLFNYDPDVTAEEVSAAYELYNEDNRKRIMNNPPPFDATPEQKRGYVKAVIETEINQSINPNQLDQYAAQYMGKPGISEDEFLNKYFSLDEPMQIFSTTDALKKSLKNFNVTEGRTFDELFIPFLDTDKDGVVTYKDPKGKGIDKFIYNRASVLHDLAVTYNYPVSTFLDEFPSWWRGLKGTFGWEGTNVPILDDIAGFTGAFKLGAEEQYADDIQYYEGEGMQGAAQYTSIAKGATDTISFLFALSKVGVSLPGVFGASSKIPRVSSLMSKSHWAYRGAQAFKALKSSQKVAVISALTEEGITMKDRVNIWKITSLYAATPAVSGMAPGPIRAKVADLAINTLITTLKKDGYLDIKVDPNLSSLEKAVLIGEQVGYDIVFSGLTGSYGKVAKQIKNAQGIAESKRIHKLALAAIKDPNNPNTLRVNSYDELFRGGFDKNNGSAFQYKEATTRIGQFLNNMEDELLKSLAKPVANEVRPTTEDVKPVAEDAKPVAEEAKPEADIVVSKDSEPIGDDPVSNPVIRELSEKIILKGLQENKALPEIDQLIKANNNRERLLQTLNAPPGTPTKTVIHKMNNLYQGKPSTNLKTKEYYKLLEDTALNASVEGSSNIQKQIRLFSDFARENLPYREADRVIARLQKLAEEGHTPMKFNDKAAAILDRSTAMQRSIDQVVGIKDMSQRVDMTEAEMLRTILKETSKAADRSRRTTINKIIASQKEAQNVLKNMPEQLRAKMLTKMRGIASAKSDDARDKRLSEFAEYSKKITEMYEKKEAEANLKFAEKEARKLLNSNRINRGIKEKIEDALTEIEYGRSLDEQVKISERATTLDEYNILSQLQLFSKAVAGRKHSELSPSELYAKAEMLNGHVKEMETIIEDKIARREKRVREDVSRTKAILSRQKEVNPFLQFRIKDPVKGVTKEMAMIPRGNAEALDFYEYGAFSRYQDKLELDWIDIYQVINDVEDIMLPVSGTMARKGFSKNRGKIKLTVKTLDGRDMQIKLGIADRSRIYLGKLDPDTWNASIESGWKLKTKKFMLSEENYDVIKKHMESKGEIEISDRIARAYQVLSKYTDDASIRINGFPMAIEVYTGPRIRESGLSEYKQKKYEDGLLQSGEINLETGKSFNTSFSNFMLEHSGRFKSRTGGNRAIIIYNPETTLNNITHLVSQFYGRGETLKEINEFIGEIERINSYDPLSGKSMLDKIKESGKGVEYEAFKTYVNLLNKSGSPDFNMGRTLRWAFKTEQAMINYLGPRALGMNPKVAFTQLASLPTAAAVMDPRDAERMYEAFGSGRGTSMEQMKSESSYLKARYSNGRVGYVYSTRGLDKKDSRWMSWVTNMDSKVIGSIHASMKQRAKDEGYEGAELLKKAEEYTVTIMMKSQPTFEDVSKPLGATERHPIIRMAFIFSSQRNKNYYLNYYSAASFAQSLSQNGIEGSLPELKNLIRVQSNLAAATAIVAMLNVQQKELRDDVAMNKYGTLPDDFYIDYTKPYGKRLLEAYGFAVAGNMGAVPSAISSLIQYPPENTLTPNTPYTGWAKDAEAAVKALKMWEEYFFLVEQGQRVAAQEWLDKNLNKAMALSARGANAAMVIPQFRKIAGGVSIDNIYKWFYENPKQWVENLTQSEREELSKNEELRLIIEEIESRENQPQQFKDAERVQEIKKKL